MVEIPSREVEKAFRIAWPNIVHHIEDEASSELDKRIAPPWGKGDPPMSVTGVLPRPLRKT